MGRDAGYATNAELARTRTRRSRTGAPLSGSSPIGHMQLWEHFFANILYIMSMHAPATANLHLVSISAWRDDNAKLKWMDSSAAVPGLGSAWRTLQRRRALQRNCWRRGSH